MPAGFIAGSAYNPAALDHSDGVLTKGSLKDQALLRALDQFHRDRVPGDTLWRRGIRKTCGWTRPTPRARRAPAPAAHETAWRRGSPSACGHLAAT